MKNHVHLIINPGKNKENLWKLMKHVAARHTRYFNKKYKQSGTIWESRYKSSPIQNDEYLSTCTQYIELNPVRAGIVFDPEAYQWSSYNTKKNLKHSWLDTDVFFHGLGKSDKKRFKKYEKWINVGIDLKKQACIREAVQRGNPTGNKQFFKKIFKLTGEKINIRKKGRPKKINLSPFSHFRS